MAIGRVCGAGVDSSTGMEKLMCKCISMHGYARAVGVE